MVTTDLIGLVLSIKSVSEQFGIPEEEAKRILKGAETFGDQTYPRYKITEKIQEKLAKASGGNGTPKQVAEINPPEIEVPKPELKTLDVVVRGIMLSSNNGLCNVTKLVRDEEFLRIIKQQPYHKPFRGRVCYIEAWGAMEFKTLYEQFYGSKQKPSLAVSAEPEDEDDEEIIGELPPFRIGQFILKGHDGVYNATKLVEKYPRLKETLSKKDYVKQERGLWLIEADGAKELAESYKENRMAGKIKTTKPRKDRESEWGGQESSAPVSGIMDTVEELARMVSPEDLAECPYDSPFESEPKRKGRPAKKEYLNDFVRNYRIIKLWNRYDITDLVQKEGWEFKMMILEENYVSQKNDRTYIKKDCLDEFNSVFYAWRLLQSRVITPKPAKEPPKPRDVEDVEQIVEGK